VNIAPFLVIEALIEKQLAREKRVQKTGLAFHPWFFVVLIEVHPQSPYTTFS
jgi:hypothetical protein